MARLAIAIALCFPVLALAAPRGAARAVLTDDTGRKVGVATLHDSPAGLCVALRLDGVAPGPKELRLERSARCAAPGHALVSARAPDAAPGAPARRLGTVEVAADGAPQRLVVPGASLQGRRSIRGGALVLADAGAASRLACGRVSGR